MKVGIAGNHLIIDEHRAVGNVDDIAADGVEGAFAHLGDVLGDLAAGILGKPGEIDDILALDHHPLAVDLGHLSQIGQGFVKVGLLDLRHFRGQVDIHLAGIDSGAGGQAQDRQQYQQQHARMEAALRSLCCTYHACCSAPVIH